jgi:hypothetical protein
VDTVSEELDDSPFRKYYIGRPAVVMMDYKDWIQGERSVITDLWTDGPRVFIRMDNDEQHDWSVIPLEWLKVS